VNATAAGQLSVAEPAKKAVSQSRMRSPAGQRFLWSLAAVVAVSAAFIAWTGFRVGGDTVTTAVDDIGEAVAALVGASAFTWFVGEVIWSVYEVGMGQSVPFPSAADAGFLAAIPLAIAGILAFPSAPARMTTRGKALADGAVVALSLLMVSWALGLGKVYETSSDQPLAQLIGAAYPAGDVVIIAVLLLVMRRATWQQRGAMVLLLLGLASNAVADSAFAYLNAAGQYGAIGSLLDAGWVVGYLLIALAPLWPAPFGDRVAVEGPVDFWQQAMPWLALLGAALAVTSYALIGRPMDSFMTAVGGGLGLMLVASSVLSHRDSSQLLAERNRAAADLEQRTATLNQVISHAPLGVVRADPETFRILDANPRMSDLLHAPAKILIGSSVPEYLSPDEMRRVMGLFQPLWEGSVETVESDSPVRRADGSEVWLHWSVTAVYKTTKRIDYFLAMYEDITAKHEAEEAAMANLAGLERLNQLKSEFVSMVSHEFRTALVGIQGFSEILRDETSSPEDVKSLATDINNDAQRLNRMIGEMLDLDRMEAGKVRLNPKPVDLNSLVAETTERAQIASTDHHITTELDGAMPTVTADPDRLVQVISNLLTNAVKYSPDGGDVKVVTRSENGSAHVSVIDQGVGIGPEFIDRVFGRYERFENSKTSRVVGTGLGLAISRQIIELHGGKIWVESKPGEGSTFQFTIPVGAKPAGS